MRVLAFITASLCMSVLSAQYPSDLFNEELREWVKENEYDNQFSNLGYTSARIQMFSFTDEVNGSIECIYTGYTQPADLTTFPDPINTEHLVPQSLFGSLEPMRSDIHVLRPCHNLANGSRANRRIEEVEDTLAWWYGIDSLGEYLFSTQQPADPDSFSESSIPGWEPRESRKGDVARQLLYFYTMYPTQAGDIADLTDVQTLYQWHLDDPVDALEVQRNDRIAFVQGNRNPYIDYPGLAFDAWLYEVPCAGTDDASAIDASTSSATLIWNPSGANVAYKVEVGPSGYDQGTLGDIVDLVTVLDTSYMIAQELDSDTDYDFYVQSLCGFPDGDSQWIGPFSFRTLPDYCAGDLFTDSGGISEGYSNSEDEVYTFCPSDPSEGTVSLEFLFVDIAVNETAQGTQDGCWDFLTIYNGVDTNSTVLAATLCGELEVSGQAPSVPSSLLQAGDTFVSTNIDGCLTVRFRSDETIAQAGWTAQVTCLGACPAPTDLEVIEIGFDGPNPRVNGIWTNANNTSDCEVRGGRIAPATVNSPNPQFANINNTQVITQTSGSSLNFNIVLFNNPNVPFVPGQVYGYEARCRCADGIGFSEWSGITPSSIFTVPLQGGLLEDGSTKSLKAEDKELLIAPNPSDGTGFRFRLNYPIEGGEMAVLDMNGRIIQSQRLNASTPGQWSEVQFDNELPPGLYLLRVHGDGTLVTERFLVD